MEDIMKSLKVLLVALGLAALGLSAGPVQADMVSGAVLTNTCFSCHGTDGKSTGDMPTIAGKNEKFITQKLMAFKKDKDNPTIMNRIAKGFSDAEIAVIAKYYAKK